MRISTSIASFLVLSSATSKSIKYQGRLLLRMSSSMSNTHPSTPEPLQMCQIDACKKKSSSALLEYQESEGGSSIVLDDCVLYAEGGGQPADFGFVQNIPVVDVQKVPSSSPYPSTAVRVTLKGQLPQEMTTVGTMLECEVNWQRRYDHMQQHTAQHLLSALAYRHFKADTVGWALGSDSVTVDLMSTPPITPAQIEELEGLVNAQIRLGTNVEWVVKPREAIVGNGDSGDDDSKDSTQQESSSDPILKSLRGAPKGAAADIPFLRLVHIDSLDLNPCGGTHLTRLSEIQMLKIIGTEKDRGATRLRFVAGQRCINLLQNCLLRESALTSMLASPPPTHVSKIEKVFQEKKVLEKQIKTLSSEIALGIGSSLASLLSNNNRVIIHHRHGADLAMLSAIADSVMASGCDASILNNSLIFLSGDAELKPEKAPSSSSSSSKGKGGGKGKDETVIPPPLPPSSSSSSSSSGSPSAITLPQLPNVSGPFMLIGSKETVDKIGKTVSALVEGKGGGRPGRMQGVASKLNAETLTLVSQTLNAALE